VFTGGDSVPQRPQSAGSRRESVSAARTAGADPQVSGVKGTRAAAAGTAACAASGATIRQRPRPSASGTQDARRSGDMHGSNRQRRTTADRLSGR